MNNFLRTFLVILSILFLTVVTLYLSMIAVFLGRSLYFLPMVLLLVLSSIYLGNRYIRQVKNKKFNIVTAICFILFLGVVLYREAPVIYKHQFDKVGSEVDLREYAPFRDGTKAVSLGEPATLKLQNNLPRLDGATALYPVYSAIGQAVYPEGNYNYYRSAIRCSKTGNAYKNLFDNEVDVIFVAQPSQAQREVAASRGLELELTPIGYEAFVFFVNNQNPVGDLTVKQIRDIYSGRITNWNQLSDRDGKIIAFQRPADSGSQTMLEKIMGDTPIMEPRQEEVVGGMGGIIEQTAEYRNFKNAIGFSFLFFATNMAANNKINILKIGGIEPTRETIKNRQYPFSGTFYAVTVKQHKDNVNIDRLIQWVLSPQGQKIIEKTGYVPL